MATLNKIFLVGHTGRDVEIRFTQTGKPVANFSVATSEWAGAGKEKNSTWHNIIVWDKAAEFCAEYLKKGDQVLIEGRVQLRDYEDRQGNKRQAYEVVAQSVQKLGKKEVQANAMLEDFSSGAQKAADGGDDDDLPF